MQQATVAVIGGGNMARAIVEGCLRARVLQPEEWLIAEPQRDRWRAFEACGVACVASAGEFGDRIKAGTQVLLAVKPQALAHAARDAAGLPWQDRIVISVLAGTSSLRVRAALDPGARGSGGPRVVRVMPNLPASIGEGATAIALGASARSGDESLALRMFGAVGPVVEQVDEALMDAFTAVAGSGPAYLLYVAEAMVRSAVAMGFDPKTAERIVRQTLAGAALLLRASKDGPGELRAAVTSKGGTTEAAISVLQGAGVMREFERALAAAERRGKELDSTAR